jgi:hypothetical protein
MKKTLRKAFAVVLAVSLFVGMISRAGAADYVGYRALDQSQPVSFDGNTVKWNGKTFTLDENTIFLDSRLDRAKLAGNPHAFNNLKEAAAAPFVEGFTPGYIQRAADSWPKQGFKSPWRVYQNYIRDTISLKWRPVDNKALEFSNPPKASSMPLPGERTRIGRT